MNKKLILILAIIFLVIGLSKMNSEANNIPSFVMGNKTQLELDTFLKTILAQWEEQNLTLSDLSKQQLAYLWGGKDTYGFSQRVIKQC